VPTILIVFSKVARYTALISLLIPFTKRMCFKKPNPVIVKRRNGNNSYNGKIYKFPIALSTQRRTYN
jgi:hypothetical protein